MVLGPPRRGNFGGADVPLVLPGLITVSILFLFVFRSRCFRWPVLAAGAAFFAGSLPFWIWNWHNDWASLHFISGGTGGSFIRGIILYAKNMAGMALDSLEIWAWSSGLVLLVVILFGLQSTWRDQSKKSSRLYLATAMGLIIVAMLFYARKPDQIGPPRYYLPLIPALAVLTGNALAALNRKTIFGGWLIFVALLVPQLKFVSVCADWYQTRHTYLAELDSLRPHFESVDSDVIFTDYSVRDFGFGMNFYYEEAFCFTEVPLQERMDTYLRKAELESNPAFFNGFRRIHDFLGQTGGSAESFQFGRGFQLSHRLKPSPLPLTPVSINYQITDGLTGQDITGKLTDNNRITYWGNHRKNHGNTLLVSFAHPVNLSMIRVLAEGRFRPYLLTVEAQYPGRDDWVPVIKDQLYTEWYWSGPRPYAHGAFDRLETRFPFGEVSALNITFNGDDVHAYIQLSELQFFAPVSEVETVQKSAPDVKPLVDYLAGQNVRHIYADRWEANQLFLHGPEDWMLSLDDVAMVKEPRRLRPEITLTESLAMVCRIENAHIVRDVLDRLAMSANEHSLHPWSIFIVHADQMLVGELPIVWRGIGPQMIPSNRWADDMCRRAQLLLENGEVAGAEEQANKVRAVWPDYVKALNVLHRCAAQKSEQVQVDFLAQRLRDLTPPQETVNVRFRNKITLTSVRLDSPVVQPGGKLKLSWFWTIPDSVDVTAWAVFLHVKDHDGNIVFQGDRILGSDRLNVAYTGHESMVEFQYLPVPEPISPGTYTLVAGIYAANPPHKRVGFRSLNVIELIYRRLVLPANLTIEELSSRTP